MAARPWLALLGRRHSAGGVAEARRRGQSLCRQTLEQPHRTGELLELCLSQLDGAHAVGPRSLEHALAHEGLPGAGAAGDPGGQVHGAAEVVPAWTTTGPAATPTCAGGSPAARISSTSLSAASTVPAGSRK